MVKTMNQPEKRTVLDALVTNEGWYEIWCIPRASGPPEVGSTFIPFGPAVLDQIRHLKLQESCPALQALLPACQDQ